MKKITLKGAVTLLALVSCVFSQAQSSWKKASASEKEIVKMNEIGVPTSAAMYSFNITGMQSKLAYAPESGTFAGKSNTILELPDAEGNLKNYRVEEASVMAPELQAKYPEIRSYAGYGDSGEYLRFTVTPYNGVNGIILYPNRSESVVIQNIPGSTADRTAIFKRSDRKTRKSFECSTEEGLSIDMNKVVSENEIQSADDATLRTFDLAMSVTGEYSAYHGGTLGSVNAAIATTVTRQNSIYEMEFAIRLVLIATNDNVIFLDANTDPYGPTDANYNSELQTALDQTPPTGVGSANYDVGHLMSAIGNNGNAGCIGCICVGGSKGSGFTTSTVPVGDPFDIDFVAHELGHQFGANHTHTHGANEGTNVQVEPGSGSTIMGYAGITGATDVQSNSDPYFHAVNITQVTVHAKSRSCDVEAATGNTNPVANAGANLTLPVGTPFRLTGTGSDADGDTITYCWEQIDEDNAADPYPDPTSTSNNKPTFRSYTPTTSDTRTFPLFSDLLSTDVNGTIWEKIPTVGRSADFRLTVRDNRVGGAANVSDDMVVTWDAARGPLDVTSQNTGGIMWSDGQTETITWAVNSTNLMTGASNVDILLSLDGGLTYPTTLVANTPNDGSQDITVPSTPAPYCRVMVQPTNQTLAPFFDINTTDFAIDYIVTTNCNQYASGPLGIAIPDGVGSNMPGAPIFDTINVTGETGNITDIADLKFNVDVSHTYIQDLVIQVTAPDGTTFNTIWNRECGAAAFDSLDVVFEEGAPAIVCASPTTGTYAPSASMASFVGQSKNGDWIIAMADYWNVDTGTLNDWYVEVCTTTEVLGVEDQSGDFANFSIFPNPGKGIVTVNLSSDKDVQMTLFDARGRMVYSQLHSNNSVTFSKEVNFSAMSSGVYLLNVSSGDQIATKKIIIQ